MSSSNSRFKKRTYRKKVRLPSGNSRNVYHQLTHNVGPSAVKSDVVNRGSGTGAK